MTPLLTGVFASQISGRLNVWQPTSAFDALATVTVPSGGLSSITFAGIPQTGYSHLQVRYTSRSNSAGINQTFFTMNGDGSGSYSSHVLYTDGGGSAGYGSYTSDGFCRAGVQGGPSLATSIFGVGIIDILDYAKTDKFKTAKTISGTEATSSGIIWMSSSNYRSLSAVRSLTFSSENGSFIENSHFALYGVK